MQIFKKTFLVSILLLTSNLIGVADNELEISEALYQKGVTYYDAGNFKEALKTFNKMQKDSPRSRRAIKGWERIAVCEYKLGNPYAAFEAYQKIWDEHKNFTQLAMINRNQLKIGDYFLENKYYENGVDVFTQVLENAPYSPIAASAQFSLAQAYLGQKEYGRAKAELGKLIDNYPDSQLVDSAAFQMGYVDYVHSEEKEYDQTATSAAIATFRQFIHEFPSSPKTDVARKYIALLRSRKAGALYQTAEFYENIRHTKAAIIMYKEVIAEYPDSSFAEVARKNITELEKITSNSKELAADAKKIAEFTANKDAAIKKDSDQEALVTAKINAVVEPAEKVVESEPVVAAEVKLPVVEAKVKVPLVPVISPDELVYQASLKKVSEYYKDQDKKAELTDYMIEVVGAEVKQDKAAVVAWNKRQNMMLLKAKKQADEYLKATLVSPTSNPANPVANSFEPLAIVTTVETQVVARVIETPVVNIDLETPAVAGADLALGITEEDSPASETHVPLAHQNLLNQKISAEKVSDKLVEDAYNKTKTAKNKESWNTLKIKTKGTDVRPVQYTTDMRKKLDTQYNINRLKKDYLRARILVEQADAARQNGLFDTAKMRYSSALDGFLDIRKKAPEWEKELVSFRVKYCRDFLSKLD